MKSLWRIIVATILGGIFGVICYFSYKSTMEGPVGAVMVAGIIANRALIGFTIGISKIKNWFWNGLIAGLFVSLAMSIYPLMGKDWMGFLAITAAGIIYGILIEVITSFVFKLKSV